MIKLAIRGNKEYKNEIKEMFISIGCVGYNSTYLSSYAFDSSLLIYYNYKDNDVSSKDYSETYIRSLINNGYLFIDFSLKKLGLGNFYIKGSKTNFKYIKLLLLTFKGDYLLKNDLFECNNENYFYYIYNNFLFKTRNENFLIENNYTKIEIE